MKKVAQIVRAFEKQPNPATSTDSTLSGLRVYQELALELEIRRRLDGELRL